MISFWVFTFLSQLPLLSTYRILDPDLGPLNASESGSPAYFVPYSPGFVGRVQDPDNPRRFRVNPGSQFSLAQPNIFRGVLPRQECPGMISVALNATDSARASTLYFCTREEAGYCDRRSGACFCYEGYQGIDCSSCRPTHFRNKESGLCEKKVLCPNDCAGGGDCDPKTGMCNCRFGRKGVDCSLHYCRLLHRWCQSCNEEACQACDPGFYVHPETKACVTCAIFDPRCVECNERGCNTCADPLLSSVRRSGRRRRDPPLPWDEDSRVLSTTIPFGSQASTSFNDAEVFFLMTDVGAAATHGVRKGAFSPASACLSGAGLLKHLSIPGSTLNASELAQLQITAAVIYSADLSSDGAAGHVRRYHLDCSPLAYADSYYGFGAIGSKIEGPIEGAVFGSHLSPISYFPGALDADDGASLVQVHGEKLKMSRIVDAHADIQQGIPYWRLGSKVMIAGSGIDQIRWQDYKGYKVDSIRGDLNTNDSALFDIKGGYEGGGPHIVYRGGREDLNDTFFLGFNYSLPLYFYTRRLVEERKAKGLMNDYSELAENGPEDDGGFYIEEEIEEEKEEERRKQENVFPSPSPSPSSSPIPSSSSSGQENRSNRHRRNRRMSFDNKEDIVKPFFSLPDNTPNKFTPLTLSITPDEVTARSSDPQSAKRLPSLPLLNASAMACEQGIHGDDSWSCGHIRQSHVLCGHPGTIFFSSPTYTVLESDKYVPITIRRTGGGLGRVSVRIELEHVTTDDTDVSLRAQYTGANELVFEEGVVSLTFRVSIHDDRLPEPLDSLASSFSRFSKWTVLPSWTMSNPSIMSSAEQAELNAARNGSSDLFAENHVVDSLTSLSPTTSAEVIALGLSQGGLLTLTNLPAGYLLRKTNVVQNDTSTYASNSTADNETSLNMEVGQDPQITAYFASLASLSSPDGKAFRNWPRSSAFTKPLSNRAISLDIPKLYNSTISIPSDAFPGTGTRQWASRLSPHETFLLKLHSPCCGAHLRTGNGGSVATVAIIDDDTFKLHPRSCLGDTKTSPLLASPTATILLGALIHNNVGPTLFHDTFDDRTGPISSTKPKYARVGQKTTISIFAKDGANFDINSSRFTALHFDAVNAPDRIPISILGKERFVVTVRSLPSISSFEWIAKQFRVIVNKILVSRYIQKETTTLSHSHDNNYYNRDTVHDASIESSWDSHPLIYSEEDDDEGEDNNVKKREERKKVFDDVDPFYSDDYFNPKARLDKGTQSIQRLAVSLARWVRASPSSTSSSTSLPLHLQKATSLQLVSALSALLYDEKSEARMDLGELEDDLLGSFIDEWMKSWRIISDTNVPSDNLNSNNDDLFNNAAIGEEAFSGVLSGKGGRSVDSVIIDASSYWPAGLAKDNTNDTNDDDEEDAKSKADLYSLFQSQYGTNTTNVYAATLVPSRAGLSEVWVQHASPGGLKASYYNNDRFSGKPLLVRVDAGINFTWGLGPLFEISKCAPCGGDGEEGLNGGRISDEQEGTWGVVQPGSCSILGSGASDFALNLSITTNNERDNPSDMFFLHSKQDKEFDKNDEDNEDIIVDPLASSLFTQTEHMIRGSSSSTTTSPSGLKDLPKSDSPSLSGCSTGSFADHVSIRWTGKLGLPEGYDSGLYQLVLFADDHVRLFIDRTLLIDAWGQGRSTSESSSDLGSRSGVSSTASSGDHGASLPIDNSDDTPSISVKRQGRFDIFPSTLEFPSLANPLSSPLYQSLEDLINTNRSKGEEETEDIVSSSLLFLQENAKVPIPTIGSRTTVCSFARLDGGSLSLLKEQTAPQDIDMACVDASIPAAVPYSSRDRIWTDPSDQTEGSVKHSRAYSAFREMQALLAAQRATGALNIADQAWVGLRTSVVLTKGKLHDITLEYRDISGWATCRLAWITPAMTTAANLAHNLSSSSSSSFSSSNDTSKDTIIGIVPVAIPQEALYSVRHISGSPFLTYVEPGDIWADGDVVDADRDMRDGGVPDLATTALNRTQGDISQGISTTADGIGLSLATAGESALFTIRPRDVFGNARGVLASQDTFLIQYTQLYLDPTIHVTSIDSNYSTSLCNHTYTNNSLSGEGRHSRHIIHIQSRYFVSSRASTSDSISMGGTRVDHREGVETHKRLNSSSIGGNSESLSRSLLFGKVNYNSTSGFIDAEWQPTSSGVCLLSVLTRIDHRLFAHLSGSPYVAIVLANHPSSRTSKVWGQGIDINGQGAVAGNPYSVIIQPRDEWNNPILVRAESIDKGSSSSSGILVIEDLSKLPKETLVNVRAYFATSEKNASVKAQTVAILIPLSSKNEVWNLSSIQIAKAKFEIQIDTDLLQENGAVGSDSNSTRTNESESIQVLRSGLKILLFVSVWTPTISGPYLVTTIFSQTKEPISSSPYPVVVPPRSSFASTSIITLVSRHTLSMTMTPHLLDSSQFGIFQLIIFDKYKNRRIGTNFEWKLGSRLVKPLENSNGTWRTTPSIPMLSNLPLDLIDVDNDAITAWVEYPIWHAMLRENDTIPEIRVRNATITYNGCCNATYTITSPCSGLICRLFVLLRGKHVFGSPFIYQRDAYDIDATTSNIFGSGLITAKVGSKNSFYLQLRDIDGNIARGINLTSVLEMKRIQVNIQRLGGTVVDEFEYGLVSNKFFYYSRLGEGFINNTPRMNLVPYKVVTRNDVLLQVENGYTDFSLLPRIIGENKINTLNKYFRIPSLHSKDERWTSETVLSTIPTTRDTPLFLWQDGIEINSTIFPEILKSKGQSFISLLRNKRRRRRRKETKNEEEEDDDDDDDDETLPYYLRARGLSAYRYDSMVPTDDIDSEWGSNDTSFTSVHTPLITIAPFMIEEEEHHHVNFNLTTYGLIEISWIPIRSGVYEISVLVDGQLVKGLSGFNSSNDRLVNTSDQQYNTTSFSFILNDDHTNMSLFTQNRSSIAVSLPLSFNAATSTLAGSILTDIGALAGVLNGLSIVARDVYGNRCSRTSVETNGYISARLRPIQDSLGYRIDPKVADNAGLTQALQFEPIDNVPGVYSLIFEPRVSGTSLIEILTPRSNIGLLAEYFSQTSSSTTNSRIYSRFEKSINMSIALSATNSFTDTDQLLFDIIQQAGWSARWFGFFRPNFFKSSSPMNTSTSQAILDEIAIPFTFSSTQDNDNNNDDEEEEQIELVTFIVSTSGSRRTRLLLRAFNSSSDCTSSARDDMIDLSTQATIEDIDANEALQGVKCLHSGHVDKLMTEVKHFDNEENINKNTTNINTLSWLTLVDTEKGIGSLLTSRKEGNIWKSTVPLKKLRYYGIFASFDTSNSLTGSTSIPCSGGSICSLSVRILSNSLNVQTILQKDDVSKSMTSTSSTSTTTLQLMKNTTLYGTIQSLALSSLPLSFLFPPLLDHVGTSPIIFTVATNLAFAPSTLVEWINQKSILGEESGEETGIDMIKENVSSLHSSFLVPNVDVVYYSNHEASFILTLYDALGNIRNDEAKNDTIVIWSMKINENGTDTENDSDFEPIYSPSYFNSTFIGQGRILVRFIPFTAGIFRLLISVNPPQKLDEINYKDFEDIALKANSLIGPTKILPGTSLDGKSRQKDTLFALKNAQKGGNKVTLERGFFTMKLLPGPLGNDLLVNSFAYGDNLTSATAGLDGIFFVQLVDRGGNNATNVNVKVMSTLAYRGELKDGPRLTTISIEPIIHGRFIVHYRAEIAGIYDCFILVDDVLTDSSPYEIHIYPARPRAETSRLLATIPSSFDYSEAARLSFNSKVSISGLDVLSMNQVIPLYSTNTLGMSFSGTFAVSHDKSNQHQHQQHRRCRLVNGTGSLVSIQKEVPIPIIDAVKIGEPILFSGYNKQGTKQGTKQVSVLIKLYDEFKNIVQFSNGNTLYSELQRGISRTSSSILLRGYQEIINNDIVIRVTIPQDNVDDTIDVAGIYWLDVLLLLPSESKGDPAISEKEGGLILSEKEVDNEGGLIPSERKVDKNKTISSSIGRKYTSHGLSVVLSSSIDSGMNSYSNVFVDVNPFQHTSLWAEELVIGASYIEWQGYLKSVATSDISFLLICDGPCILSIDRNDIAVVTKEMLFNNKDCSGGKEIESLSLRDNINMCGNSIGIYRMRDNESYSISITLERLADTKSSSGFIKLFWAWRDHDIEKMIDLGENVEKMHYIEIDVKRLYYAGQHVYGSPIAVQVR